MMVYARSKRLASARMARGEPARPNLAAPTPQRLASARVWLVPRTRYDRTLHGKRSSPARGTTFSDTRDGLRMQRVDYQRALKQHFVAIGVERDGHIGRIAGKEVGYRLLHVGRYRILAIAHAVVFVAPEAGNELGAKQ